MAGVCLRTYFVHSTYVFLCTRATIWKNRKANNTFVRTSGHIVSCLILGGRFFFDTTSHHPHKICNDQKLQGPTCVLIPSIDSHHSDHGGRPPLPYEANKAVDANETDEANKVGEANEESESHCGR